MQRDPALRLASIVAVADNGVIGCDNKIAWKIRSEMLYFRDKTLGHPVIMGRKTFNDLGKPLPKRPNIVVTRDAGFQADGVIVRHSLEDAVKAGQDEARRLGVDTVFIGGGSEIYALAMPYIDRLYYTEIHLSPEGDARFPAFDRADFRETFREYHPKKDGEDAAYTITVLDRIRPAQAGAAP